MYDFHKDKKRYFDIQHWVTKHYIIPFIEAKPSAKVLEIGCAEAGVLKAFLEQGHEVVGIELSPDRAKSAEYFLIEYIDKNRAKIINKNIYEIDPSTDFRFDVIVLKDVIEHIPDHKKFLIKLQDLLKEDGVVFFAFPPWWMPFGGHQQICHHKLLSKLPWIHLLPSSLYRSVLKAFGENEHVVNELMDIKSTHLLIDELHRLLDETNYKVLKETSWLTNPIYVKKFGFKPFKSLINIPYLRNIYCTAHYILFTKNNK